MAAIPTISVEAKLDGTNWTDITADVIGNISAEYGIRGNSPLDRVASPGEANIILNNSETNSAGLIGYYTPGGVNCRTGFDTGLIIRIRITHDGRTKTKFYGRVPQKCISPQPGILSAKRTTVKIRDWIDQASIHELSLPSFQQNKKISEVVAAIVANMPTAPLSTDYKDGQYTFPSVFDTVRSKTIALSEFQKVAISELGYIYSIPGIASDEVLVVEGQYTRNNDVATLSEIPCSKEDIGKLKLNAGGFLKLNAGGYLLLNCKTTVTFNNAFISASSPYGENSYNRIKSTAYPRRVDASAVTLATLQTSIAVNPSESVKFILRYRDPAGISNNVSGINMINPVTTTDYLANSAADGSGTNLTANFSLSVTFGTGDAEITVTNNGGSAGYLLSGSKLRGYGVYIDDPIDSIEEDTANIAQNGTNQLTLDCRYQADPLNTLSFSQALIDILATPRIDLSSVTFCANRSTAAMLAFMYAEIGMRIHVNETVNGIDGDFYIQNVKYTIQPGGLIYCTWILKNSGYDAYGFAVWDTDAWDDGSKWGF